MGIVEGAPFGGAVADPSRSHHEVATEFCREDNSRLGGMQARVTQIRTATSDLQFLFW